MLTTFTNLVPAASYTLFLAAKVGPWIDARTLPPGAGVSTANATSSGTWQADLTIGQEYALVGPDPLRPTETVVRRTLVSSTKGGTP